MAIVDSCHDRTRIKQTDQHIELIVPTNVPSCPLRVQLWYKLIITSATKYLSIAKE